MLKYVTGIRTESGDLPIDYNALVNKPQIDKTLSEDGKLADAKATGDAIKSMSDNLSSEIETFKTNVNTSINELSSGIDTLEEKVDTFVSDFSSDIETLETEINKKIESLFSENEDGETVIQTPIVMNDNKITGLGTPEEDTDAATKKYVDDKHFYLILNKTLSTEWVGDTAPYTQELLISEIAETDCPHIAPVYSNTLDTAIVEREAWAKIYKAETGQGIITFSCFEEKPLVELNIQIEVIR